MIRSWRRLRNIASTRAESRGQLSLRGRLELGRLPRERPCWFGRPSFPGRPVWNTRRPKRFHPFWKMKGKSLIMLVFRYEPFYRFKDFNWRIFLYRLGLGSLKFSWWVGLGTLDGLLFILCGEIDHWKYFLRDLIMRTLFMDGPLRKSETEAFFFVDEFMIRLALSILIAHLVSLSKILSISADSS